MSGAGKMYKIVFAAFVAAALCSASLFFTGCPQEPEPWDPQEPVEPLEPEEPVEPDTPEPEPFEMPEPEEDL